MKRPGGWGEEGRERGEEKGGKERIGFFLGRERVEIGEVHMPSLEFGLWLEGGEALLLGLVFDFSTPGFLPATQDALSWGGLFGIGYFFNVV